MGGELCSSSRPAPAAVTRRAGSSIRMANGEIRRSRKDRLGGRDFGGKRFSRK